MGSITARWLDRGQTSRARGLARDEVLAARGLSPWIRMIANHVLGRLGGPQQIRYLLAAARNADTVHTAGSRPQPIARPSCRDEERSIWISWVRSSSATARSIVAGLSVSRTGSSAGWLLDELARRSDRGDDDEVRRWQDLRCRLSALLHDVEGEGEPRVRRSGLKLYGEIADPERDVRGAETDLARRWPVAWNGIEFSAADELLKVLPERDCFVEYLLDRDNLVVFRVLRGSIDGRGGARRITRACRPPGVGAVSSRCRYLAGRPVGRCPECRP